MEDFKNYQIIKLNILRNEEEYDEANQFINKERKNKKIAINSSSKNDQTLTLPRFKKKNEDLTSLERTIIEEEIEQIKSNNLITFRIEMKIRRLERTLTKELQNVVRKSNKIFR